MQVFAPYQIQNGLIFQIYKPRENKDGDLSSLILNIWLDRNNKGWRSIQADLRVYHDTIINHKKLRRLMKKPGIRGIMPKINTSKGNKVDYKYPYALKNMNIYIANLVWCSDIKYIKLPQGHVYLVAIVDIYSRMILDYEISNTLDAEFYIRCLERSIKRYGTPAVFNTDQGFQYTINMWINVLQNNHIIVSMDCKGDGLIMFGLKESGEQLNMNAFIYQELRICNL